MTERAEPSLRQMLKARGAPLRVLKRGRRVSPWNAEIGLPPELREDVKRSS